MNKEDLYTFIHKIYNISGKIQQLRSSDIILKSGEVANTAGLATLKFMSENPDMKMSEISKTMGVTKGAISQMTVKLQNKGFIEKHKCKGNEKNCFIKITEKGYIAIDEYNKIHDSLYDGIDNILSKYDASEFEIINKFILETEEYVCSSRNNISCKEPKECEMKLLNIGR